MLFSHDTELSLAETAALVNTVELDGDTLVTLADLDDFLARHPYSGVIHRTQRNSNPCVPAARLRKFWTVADRDEAAALVNQILEEADARPTCPDTMSGTGTCTSPARTPRCRPHRGRRGDGLSRSDQGRRARPAADLCRRGLRGCAGRSFQELLEALLRHRKLRQPDQRCRIPRTQTPAERMKPSRRAAVPPLR